MTTLQAIWMPTYITRKIWFGTNTSGPPNYTLTMTQGQTYTYTQEFGRQPVRRALSTFPSPVSRKSS